MKAEKQDKFIVRSAKGWLWWLAGEFICVIFNMCMIVFISKFMVMKIFTAFASLIIANGLYFNYAYNTAVRDRNLIKYHGVNDDKQMALKMALITPLPQYLMWIVLLLSKIGAVGDIFRYYILANMQSLAWVDLFTEGRAITDLSWAGLIGLLFLDIIASVVIYLTYQITIHDIDIKALLLYGKKDR